MADTLINKMQHSGKDIKIPQDMIAQLPTTLQELDRAITQAQATLEALGNIATVSTNGNANQYLNGQGQFSTPPNTVYSHPSYTTRSGVKRIIKLFRMVVLLKLFKSRATLKVMLLV